MHAVETAFPVNQLPKIDAEINEIESTETNNSETRIKPTDLFMMSEEREREREFINFYIFAR